MSQRIPNETQTRTRIVMAPVEFDNLLNPNLSSLSMADFLGLSHQGLINLVTIAAIRMPTVLAEFYA